MSYILNIETATKNCSVSLGKEGIPLDVLEYTGEGYSHAEKLHVFIREILERNHLSASDLSAVAVSKGPGSYTGLRIGVSAAKGMAYALDIPLISVGTLESLARQVQDDNAYIIPVIDARRMEVYSAVFDEKYRLIREVQANILDNKPFDSYLHEKKVIFVGDATGKMKQVLQHPNACYAEKLYPSAEQMVEISYKKLLEKKFEDVAYFDPFYLKDFIITKKK